MQAFTGVTRTGLGLALAIAIVAVPATAGAGDIEVRSRLAAGVVEKWSGHVEAVYGVDGETWARRMTATFDAASLEDLRLALGQDDFQAMSEVLLGHGDDIAPAALGDPEGNLVFTPINACRIIDTRIVGGEIAAEGSRNFVAATLSDFTSQGGIAGNCGIPLDISAVTANVSAANPVLEGYFTAYPANSPLPLAASLTFQGGLRDDTNGTVISLCSDGNCQPDFTVYASKEAHLVIDVTGYFAPPEATALDCVTQTESGSLSLLPTLQSINVTCPAGYAATGGGCGGALGVSVGYSRPLVVDGRNVGWNCGLLGSVLSILGYEASASCCRIPGR